MLSAGQAALAGGQFKCFPETISPDGAYALAWGRAPEAAGDLAQLTEAAYEDAVFDETNQDEEVNNYLVDAVAHKAIAIIPGFHYLRGPKLNKNRADLAVAWSPDGECALAVQRDDLREAQMRWLKLREQISDEESRRRFTERRATELRALGP